MNSRGRVTCVFMVILVLTFVFGYFNVFYYPDRVLTDGVYQTAGSANPDIRIIMIDDETLAKYGEFSTWSRSKVGELISKLNESDKKPAAIAVDVTYFGESDSAADNALAEACKDSDNVIMASSIKYRMDGRNIVEDGEFVGHESHYVEGFEYPYQVLNNNVFNGFANTFQDKDGYVRMAKLHESHEGVTVNSLGVETLRVYEQNTGKAYQLPDVDSDNNFLFKYTRKYGGYDHVSMCKVLEDDNIARSFAGSIVLIGAYASGMQDAYNVPIDRGTPMNGVEIHANIIQAIMDGNTALKANVLISALIGAVIAAGYYLLMRKLKVVTGALVGAALIAAYIFTGKLLFSNGIRISLVTVPIMVITVYVYELVIQYITERIHKRQVIDAFKKYVAPQVVDELAKKGEFEIRLGGEKRDIAVLFVDIRGFTPMSESLEPEQVVEILNEYLALTTKSIFNNGGTLDKFIGDATMAVFNAPFDLDEYIYRAVCTARDIAAGSEELEKNLSERFGKTVSFGIGVNCGPGVVGNIGCDFRMDYTAIGDTVNTAARLESNAKPGQILISEHVYEKLKDRLEVTDIGVIPLKGKSQGIMVYSVDKVL